MPTRSVNKKNNDSAYTAAVVVLLLLAAAFLYLRGNKQGAKQQASVHKELPSGLHGSINEHLKDGARRTEILRDQAEIENAVAPTLGPEDVRRAEDVYNRNRVHQLRMDQENSAAAVARELEKNSKGRRPLTPDERISQKRDRDAFLQDYNKKYEKEYVEQFLQNAREQGVDVRLDDNFNVTGIETFEVEKPIRVPQSVPSGAELEK